MAAWCGAWVPTRTLRSPRPWWANICTVNVEDLEEKEAVLAAGKRGIFTIEHFDNYPAILVKLDAIAPQDLHEVVVEAWLCRAPKRLCAAYIDRG